MIVLLDTSEDLTVASVELGGLPVEQLLTPLTRFLPQQPESRFAIDNGAYAGFDASAFRALLVREKQRRHLCRFVAVPDVVGSGRRTLELYDHWRHDLHGWPLAFVAQDGTEELPMPWPYLDAVFVGGSTRWKMSGSAVQTIRAAQAFGKWVHVGRINTPGRFEYFDQLGVDSIDGTGLARYSHMREKIAQRHEVPVLDLEGAA
jgi:hypothetical protein